jgi:hypothetical protein
MTKLKKHRGNAWGNNRARHPSRKTRCTSARQLAHQEQDEVRRAYTHAAEYWPERIKMMQAWADYLDQLREGGKAAPLVKTGRSQ